MLNPIWISKHMPNEVWDEITYAFPNCNGAKPIKFGNQLIKLYNRCSYVSMVGSQLNHSSTRHSLCIYNIPITWMQHLQINESRISMSSASSCNVFGVVSFMQPIFSNMMASSNGNIFRVTCHLCGEFSGHRWIPHTKASDAALWYFLNLNKQLSKQSWGWSFETPSRPLWRHCNEVTHTKCYDCACQKVNCCLPQHNFPSIYS